MGFDLLFKYSIETFRRGELVFAPFVDPGVLAAIAIIGVLLIGATQLRGAGARRFSAPQRVAIVGLQVLVLAIVIGLLARPMLRVTELVPGANRVALLFDDSASMALPAAHGGSHSRREAALAALRRDVLPAITDLAVVDTYLFDTTTRAAPIDASTAAGEGTRLAAAVDQVLRSYRDSPLAALVVVSDGAENGRTLHGSSPGRAAVPIHTVGIGPEHLEGDLELVAVVLPGEATPHGRIVAHALVRHSGTQPADLKVWEGDALIARQPLDAPATPGLVATDVEIDTGPAGIRLLRFAVSGPTGEAILDNNARERILSVTPRTLSVLYLEGEPRWEYKFLRRALAQDESLQVASWIRTSPRKSLRQGVTHADELADGFPADRAALYAYDLVVLGALPAELLDAAQHEALEAFVRLRGGSLLALAGRGALADGGWDRTPLAAALPVRLAPAPDGAEHAIAPRATRAAPRATRATVRLTRAGALSPLTRLQAEGDAASAWSSLPAVGDLQALGVVKPGATVLLEAEDARGVVPLLVEQRYGRGRTAVLATSSTWRWQTVTPPDDPRHARFWAQLVHQLAETAPPRIALSVVPEAGGDVVARVAVRDMRFAPVSTARVEISIAEGAHSMMRRDAVAGAEPGTFEARFSPPSGMFRVDATVYAQSGQTGGLDTQRGDLGSAAKITLTRFVQMADGSPEAFDAAQDRERLTRLATDGGRYWSLEEASGLAEALRFSNAGVTSRRVLDLWNAPIFFVLLLLTKCAEWLLRRRWGSL